MNHLGDFIHARVVSKHTTAPARSVRHRLSNPFSCRTSLSIVRALAFCGPSHGISKAHPRKFQPPTSIIQVICFLRRLHICGMPLPFQSCSNCSMFSSFQLCNATLSLRVANLNLAGEYNMEVRDAPTDVIDPWRFWHDASTAHATSVAWYIPYFCTNTFIATTKTTKFKWHAMIQCVCFPFPVPRPPVISYMCTGGPQGSVTMYKQKQATLMRHKFKLTCHKRTSRLCPLANACACISPGKGFDAQSSEHQKNYGPNQRCQDWPFQCPMWFFFFHLMLNKQCKRSKCW